MVKVSTNNRKYLFVIVKEFGDLNNIKLSIIKYLGLSMDQCKAFDFDCSPKTSVIIKKSNTNERKLTPLVNFENLTGNDISSAYNIILQNVSDILFSKQINQQVL
jgi:hypothetical protein